MPDLRISIYPTRYSICGRCGTELKVVDVIAIVFENRAYNQKATSGEFAVVGEGLEGPRVASLDTSNDA